jgi:hydroxyacylglutathione hydrolase
MKLKFSLLVLVALALGLTVLVDQRVNLLLLIMATSEPPPLLEPQDQGADVSWFDDYYTVQAIDENTFAIGEPRYFQKNFNYLILGESRAIVFDAGTGQRDIRSVVQTLTDLPVTFIPSHLHYDHIGNDIFFDHTALIDLPHLKSRAVDNALALTRFEHLGEVEGFGPAVIRVDQWLSPNEVIDLGGRLLRVLYTPGHTPDSISLYDAEAGYLFAGDFLYPGPLYAFLPNSSLGDYLQGAETIQAVRQGRLRVFGAHRDGAIGLPELGLDNVNALKNSLLEIRSSVADSTGIYPVSYTVDDQVVLLSEPKWLQNWEAMYPSLHPRAGGYIEARIPND